MQLLSKWLKGNGHIPAQCKAVEFSPDNCVVFCQCHKGSGRLNTIIDAPEGEVFMCVQFDRGEHWVVATVEEQAKVKALRETFERGIENLIVTVLPLSTSGSG